MAKSIKDIQLHVQGVDKLEGPLGATVHYTVFEPGNSPGKESYRKIRQLSPEIFSKKLQENNVEGELWYDLVMLLETEESIDN